MVNPLWIVGGFFLLIMVLLLVILSIRSWNIPVTILRFMGNKERPMVIQKKARKRMIKGVPHLQVKGYKNPMRDFKSDFYWPANKGKYGALILWEFEDGWLTPTIPKRKRLTPEEEAVYRDAIAKINAIGAVKFEYNPDIHHELRLKIVDDVDMEFLVEQLARQDSQYSSGFWGFMEKYGTHMLLMIIVVCLLVGFIIYIKNAPNLGAECLAQLEGIAKQGWLDRATGSLAPGG